MDIENVETKKVSHTTLVVIIVTIIVITGSIITAVISASSNNTLKYEEQLDLGKKYLYELSYDQAVLAFREAIEIDPQKEEAYICLAYVYTQQGKITEVNEMLDNAVKQSESENIKVLKKKIQEIKGIEEKDLKDIIITVEKMLSDFDYEFSNVTDDKFIDKNESGKIDSINDKLLKNTYEYGKELEAPGDNNNEREYFDEKLEGKSDTQNSYVEKVEINSENFPDDVFRKYVTNLDTNMDGFLSEEETITIRDILCYGDEITSLKGIEYFMNLEVLNCQNNALQELDLSNNKKLKTLWCDHNNITHLDFSLNLNLCELQCGENPLTMLNIQGITALKELRVDDAELTELNLDSNTELVQLWCQNNKLNSIDIGNNKKLIEFGCTGNNIKKIDLSNNTLIEQLHCGENRLTDLDLRNLIHLKELLCYDNQLEELDVTKNTMLEDLGIANNHISSLNLCNNHHLKELHCYNNEITNLDLSNNEDLEFVQCMNNKISFLDLTNNKKLQEEGTYVDYDVVVVWK